MPISMINHKFNNELDAIFLLYNGNELENAIFSQRRLCTNVSCVYVTFHGDLFEMSNRLQPVRRVSNPAANVRKHGEFKMVYCAASVFVPICVCTQYTPASWIFIRCDSEMNMKYALGLFTNDNLFHSIHRQSTCMLLYQE